MEMYMNLFTEVWEANKECNPWKLVNERLLSKAYLNLILLICPPFNTLFSELYIVGKNIIFSINLRACLFISHWNSISSCGF